MSVVVHAAGKRQGCALGRRTMRHASYEGSQLRLAAVKGGFGWLKWAPGLKQGQLRWLAKVGRLLKFPNAAYNPWRLPQMHARAA